MCSCSHADTVIGDPLFTVPLPASAGHLCYEIRGVADQFFNFISDECVSVNAHYSERSPLPGETRQLHIIDQIAIRAVDNANDCINILVDRNGCVTTANRETISNAYNKGGVTVSAADNRVVVGVPNCGDLDLEMEVVCETRNGVEMIRFEVMRGHNLRDTSHGLLGMLILCTYCNSMLMWNGLLHSTRALPRTEQWEGPMYVNADIILLSVSIPRHLY